jgi:hypothetical protein
MVDVFCHCHILIITNVNMFIAYSQPTSGGLLKKSGPEFILNVDSEIISV